MLAWAIFPAAMLLSSGMKLVRTQQKRSDIEGSATCTAIQKLGKTLQDSFFIRTILLGPVLTILDTSSD